MVHCCLSYSLKSVVERLHGPALAARRARIGAAERKTYSVVLTQSQLGMLPLTEPAARLLAELAVFFPRLANLGWKELAAAWVLVFFFFFFVCVICASGRAGPSWIGEQISREWHDLLADPDRSLDIWERFFWDRMLRQLAGLPSLIVQIFIFSFAFFFVLFLALQYLIQRRNDRAAGLR